MPHNVGDPATADVLGKCEWPEAKKGPFTRKVVLRQTHRQQNEGHGEHESMDRTEQEIHINVTDEEIRNRRREYERQELA